MAVNWRKIFTSPYSDKTHFIYELIQNADDSKSKHLELQLRENELIVWNDGRQFTKQDVNSICSIGFSNKDLTQIGTFGMGITSVFTYTDCLEVYSGDEHFRIRIKDPTKREIIDFDDIDSIVIEQLNRGRTVFRLPFRKKLRQEDIEKLRDRLCNVGEKRPLLFLRYLERIVWKNELSTQIGSYFCHRCPHDKMQDASEVELTTSLDDNNQQTETFLVFHKKSQPPQDVIDELLYQAEDDTEQQRIQQSVKKPQPIEVAFRLQDSKITVMADKCMLFSYLSTQKETHLRFIIQARYQTTLARENIEEIEDNLWNRWLVQETADFLPKVLERLKSGGLLEPAFFDVLPLKGEVEKAFKPIAKTLRKAMRERLLVPTQDGAYTKAENVLYPHDELLRELFESSWLSPNSSWLHPDIQDKTEFDRRFRIMQKAGVEEIDFRKILRWLEEQGSDWFESKSNEWLCSLYTYLSKHQSELERIKKLSLVRLENRQHVCASEAFLPPDTDEAREEIAPFLNELPILQSALLEGEEGNDIKLFLDKLGVRGLDPKEMVGKWILAQYSRCDKPSKEQNRLHVRYIFKVWNKFLGYHYLREKISETPILRSYRGSQPETFDSVKPCDAYLPEAYTGDTDLENYFSVYDGEVWFIDSGYLDGNSNPKEWFQFLKAIGAMDTPRVDKIEVVGNKAECKKRRIEYQESRKPFEDGEFKDVSRRGDQYFDGHIVDPCWIGLSQVLAQIKKRNGVNLSCSVWKLLIKKIKPLSPEIQRGLKASSRDDFFQGTYSWVPPFKRTAKTEKFESLFHRDLIDTDWLPDEQGELHKSSKLFAPTDENRKLLGNSMPYLHPDFDVSGNNETAQWLAEKLRIHLNADTKSVMNSLQTLSGTEASVKKVKLLYRFLSRQWDLRSEEFEKLPLIFTPNPESRWWRVDEVFWEDKSGVLESDHRCLKAHYPALRSFFINLEVSEQASQRDYACRIQEIATTEQAADKKVRESLRRLYKCLITWQKNEWEIIYDDRCWLGKKGKEWEFFTRQELVLKDHPHIGEIFEGKIPFWTFDDDLSSLASILKIEGCSKAQVEFHSQGDQEEDTDLSEKVRNLCPDIYAFLKSSRFSEKPKKEKFAEVLEQVSVRRVNQLKVTYNLNGIPVPDPNPRLSFLDVTGQPVILWLGQEANEGEYAELIGDALQDHFDIKELGRFVEDLLTPTKKRDRVLSNWKRKGLETKFLNEDPKDDEKKRIEFLDEKLSDEPNNEDVDPAVDESNMKIPTDNEIPKTDGEDSESLTDKADESEIHLSSNGDDNSRTDGPEIETPIDSETVEIDKSDGDSTSDESKSPTNLASDITDLSSRDTQSSTKTGSGTTQNANEESESETPTVHEDPETANENGYSTENKSETASYQPGPGGSRTRSREGKGINTPNRNRGTDHSSNRSRDMEDDAHMEETDASPQARKEIERIGMEHALRYEEEQGHTVEDVSAENLGYDLRSTTPKGEIRYIEVKARAERALVVLTSNEWDTAERLKDSYFLYVVLNAKTQPEPYIIQNPADKVAVDERYDVRYQVPFSEITEHGILV
ncbi:MAG: DUF3883 domain-containing protein [Candidatus Poribacteria bacterium]|nr:DUF3883 domain-containing protein [Candidatus Poribacteria bacterium]